RPYAALVPFHPHGRCSPQVRGLTRHRCPEPSCCRLVRALYVLLVSIVAEQPHLAARSESAVLAAHVLAVAPPNVALFLWLFHCSVLGRRSPRGTPCRSAQPPGFSGKARRMLLGSCQ